MRTMKKNNNETVMVIGIDHGYGNMKTATRCFPSGVARYDKEPIFQNNLLVYNDMYYQIGEEHKEFCAEKTQDEDYYVLTLAAIASNIFLLSTLIFPEKSATKNVKRNSLIHRFPDIERTVLTEISWIFFQDVFDLLLSELGPQTYSQLFPIILTDNGSSFLDPSLFEMPHRQDVLTKVFYCDPMSSWQKGRLEKNHEFIRYILPKGTSFDSLTEQNVNLMMNHINSTARASLNGCTPFQLALLLLDAKLMSLMDLRSVPADQIHLKPDLIK